MPVGSSESPSKCANVRIAIIGAGPIGLEAAVAASSRGFTFDVYEAGDIGTHIRSWGHVVLFTPFSMNRAVEGVRTIQSEDPSYEPPGDETFLTGRDYVDRYLVPLARCERLASHIHTDHRVISVGRSGFLKTQAIGSDDRLTKPFHLLVETSNGKELGVEADVVIDATGVYGQPNHCGNGGVRVPGEQAAGDQIHLGLDDILGADRHLYAGKHTALIGGRYSAATSIVALRELVDADPNTNVIWFTMSDRKPPIPEFQGDRLPARAQLTKDANRIAMTGHDRIRHMGGVVVERFDKLSNKTLVIEVCDRRGHQHTFEVDRVLANVGYQPDVELHRELQVHECYATQAPMKLATTLIGQDSQDCLDRTPGEPETLLNPEPNFFIVGAKSYGRDSTFLMQTGISQVRDVFSLLTERYAAAS